MPPRGFESQMQSIEPLLAELIAHDSVSANGNRPLMAALAQRCEDAGARVALQEWGEGAHTKANVVAVLEAAEDLDGPPTGRAMREREVSVVARAYGYRRGEFSWPLAFATPGWKRVTLTLVTDERELSDPVTVELLDAAGTDELRKDICQGRFAALQFSGQRRQRPAAAQRVEPGLPLVDWVA